MNNNAKRNTPNAIRFKGASGFTLIELLVVISIIGVLAAMVFPVTWAVNRIKIQSRSRAELAAIEGWIELYKAKLGHYPPDNGINYFTNQLYFELAGATFNEAKGTYTTLTGDATMAPATVVPVYGQGFAGIANSTRGGGGDEATAGVKFMSQVKQTALMPLTNGPTILIGPEWKQGPAPFNYDPINTAVAPSGANPWRYNYSSPKHNTSSYDLWIDVMIGKKCYRICNWSPKAFSIQDPSY